MPSLTSPWQIMTPKLRLKRKPRKLPWQLLLLKAPQVALCAALAHSLVDDVSFCHGCCSYLLRRRRDCPQSRHELLDLLDESIRSSTTVVPSTSYDQVCLVHSLHHGPDHDDRPVDDCTCGALSFSPCHKIYCAVCISRPAAFSFGLVISKSAQNKPSWRGKTCPTRP